MASVEIHVADTTSMSNKEWRTYAPLREKEISCPPLYNVHNTAEAGKPVHRVIDASGEDHYHTLEVNIETGRIVKLQVNEKGGFETYEGELVKTVVYAPTPITIEFHQ